jgi:hypothetical protein
MGWAAIFHWGSLQPGRENAVLNQAEGAAITLTLLVWAVILFTGGEIGMRHPTRRCRPAYAHILLGVWAAASIAMLSGFLMTETTLTGNVRAFDYVAYNVLGLQQALTLQIADTLSAAQAVVPALQQAYALQPTGNPFISTAVYGQAMQALGGGQLLLQGMGVKVASIDVRQVVEQVRSELNWFDAIHRPCMLSLGIVLLFYIVIEYALRTWTWHGPIVWAELWDKVLFVLLSMLIWAGVFQLLAASVLGASVCYDPTAVASAYMNDSLATYYTQCNFRPELPFPYAAGLSQAVAVLHELQDDSYNASTVCTEMACTGDMFLAVAGLHTTVTKLHDSVGMPDEGLMELVGCESVNEVYRQVATYLCDDLGAAFANYFLYALLFLLCWSGSCLTYTLLNPALKDVEEKSDIV